MQKLSAEQIQGVLSKVPETLRKLASERDYWRKEAETRIRHEEALKVANAMHEKGMEQHVPLDILVERMEKAAERGELKDIERAVDLVGPDMGAKLAQLTGEDRKYPEGSDPLTLYLVGDVG
jgi:hypothetical protein